MPKKHANIPIFIPHLGCPHTCVFCNQRSISGVEAFAPESIREQIDTALKTINLSEYEVEIAFFGGSFTGIDCHLMCRLLDIASSYCKDGLVSGIRLSTRPDYINDGVLNILKNYPITAVELGIQSISDTVLSASERGHTADDIRTAISLLKDSGFSIVGQMMIGLPLATPDDEMQTARFLIECGVSAVRIYPTVVFYGTCLQKMTEEGAYRPLTLDEAILRSADVFEAFIEADIPVIRIGLCANDALLSDKSYFAGPNHPAIGEYVKGELYRRLIEKQLPKEHDGAEHLILSVPPRSASLVAGQKRCYKKALLQKYKLKKITIQEVEDQPPYTVTVRLANINKG